MSSTRGRTVILFGAGAAMDWNAPSTGELTELVKNSGFLITGNSQRVTNFIYEQLRAAGWAEADVNFETIINVVEELIVYYSSFSTPVSSYVAGRSCPSIPQVFLNTKWADQLLNFSVLGSQVHHGFKLDIPGIEREFAKSAVNSETAEQFYLQQLLAYVLTDIVARISRYSYHTREHTKVITAENKTMNSLFADWIAQLHEHNVVRLYNLNYDRNFKVILETQSSLEVFEGFDCTAEVDYGSRLLPNVRRILTDTDSLVHYNLHGSAFWGVESRDAHGLPNPYYYLSEAPELPINSYEYPLWQGEKGKTVMLTNIITGYQKAQRTMLPPFKQMQAAFDRDCCTADQICIVGYSFGDDHINSSIRTAVQNNAGLQVTIVEPFFTKNNFDVSTSMKIFSGIDHKGPLATTIADKLHSFCDGRFVVHERTFREYLSRQLSPAI